MSVNIKSELGAEENGSLQVQCGLNSAQQQATLLKVLHPTPFWPNTFIKWYGTSMLRGFPQSVQTLRAVAPLAFEGTFHECTRAIAGAEHLSECHYSRRRHCMRHTSYGGLTVTHRVPEHVLPCIGECMSSGCMGS